MGTLIFVFGVLLAAGNLFVQRSGKPLKP